MNLLLLEIVLACAALRRGWRAAPVLLFAASAAAVAWAPAGLGSVTAQALALVSLAAICAVDPAEPLARPPRRQRTAGRQGAALPDLTLCQIPGSAGRIGRVRRRDPMAARLDYPVYDADNHFYEPQEALLAPLPRKYKKDVQYAVGRGSPQSQLS